jgi:hypothetical protein
MRRRRRGVDTEMDTAKPDAPRPDALARFGAIGDLVHENILPAR